ncbi:MAG TPA: 4Fe-4S binding protein [bacterium]|nr:4Fe-4S binding protein [bacterium]
MPRLISEYCSGCGICESACDEQALTMSATGLPEFDMKLCTGCGNCVETCPNNAIVRGKAV